MGKISYSKLKLKINNNINTISYTIDNDEYVIEVKQYLPFEEKISILEKVINLSKDEMHFYNTSKLNMFLDLQLVEKYTNITFSDSNKENFIKTYDELLSSGLIKLIKDHIPSEELTWLETNLYETVNSIYKYNNSIYGIMNTITADYSKLGGELAEMQEKISNPENLGLLKDVLTKLG